MVVGEGPGQALAKVPARAEELDVSAEEAEVLGKEELGGERQAFSSLAAGLVQDLAEWAVAPARAGLG